MTGSTRTITHLIPEVRPLPGHRFTFVSRLWETPDGFQYISR